MSKKEVTGRLTVYLRGGAVIDLPNGTAQIDGDESGRPSSISITNQGTVEIVWLDTSEVVAVVKEGARQRYGVDK
ncbi:MAG TPA: hypothetical protein VFE05_16175 [Longimicrobiaceae bacterium]|jgi:hypothetical protein|nr:hypothetical protein [Longimicrobiaceae bacterium]